MRIQLTNTLSRSKEVFEPADAGRVTLYVCGPTVYNYAHIGNARPPVVFDTLFRLLRRTYGDSAVIYARNYTDIDDKIIAAAQAAGQPIEAITEKFRVIYEQDMGALGVLPPTLAPRATQHVDDMIALIEKLIEAGAAYAVPSGVYFAVAKDADYGKLSGRSQDELRAGARVEGEDDKQGPSDFALWKAAKPGEPAWDAPFGRGRPGWHIECSAMIESALGSPIDIHGGGLDLIFPHHENEIAQSESAHGRALARVWMHNGFLTMDKEKMSKSIGNIVTVNELLAQGWQGETIRWALLSAHYRAPLDWSDDLLKQAQASLDRLYQVLRDADYDRLDEDLHDEGESHYPVGSNQVDDIIKPFLSALSDDLNTPRALAELNELAKAVRDATGATAEDDPQGDVRSRLMLTTAALRSAASLLGILQSDPNDWFRRGMDTSKIDALVAQRVEARKAKDFAASDRIRDQLAAMGVEVMDSASGSTWRRKG